jgi:alpha-mannosidase
MEVVEEGPVRAVVRVVRKTERSTITQDIALYALHSRVEVNTHVDWNEKRALLKVAFPVAIHSHRATYDIQYGAIERATHDSTAHDRARFEVPAHHWADLSEGNYGVSLLNDCKYGYDVKDNIMRLSLLRASVDPDEHADEGEHTMTYALYPHGGDWRNGTVQEGFDLNVPLVAHVVPAKKGNQLPVGSFATTDAENVLIDNIKKAEDDDAIIVRLYEAFGQRGKTTVTFAQTPKKVAMVDMMEENPKPLKVSGNSVRLEITPWEIHTLRVAF